MFLLFDNLTATIIGGTIILVISAISLGIQQASTERAVVHAAKQGLLTIAEFMERDIHTAGSGLNTGEQAITGAGEDWIEIQYRLEEDNPQPLRIRYEAVPVDTLISPADTLVLYELQRKENGVITGRSLPYIAYVSFALLDENEQEVGSPSGAVMIRVRLSMALPFDSHEDAYIRRLYWGTTFRPLALRDR